MKKRKSTTSQKNKATSFIKSVFAGAGAGIVIWALLLVGAAYILSGFDSPEKFVTVTAFVLIALCAFASGLISVKLSGMGNALPGFVSGICLLTFVWVLSLAVSRDSEGSSLILKLIIVFDFLFFSLLGGLSGRPSGKIKRRAGR